MMAALGAPALATTSAGLAFTLGRPDMGNVTRDEALTHAERLDAATPLPVSGDLENGFGDSPATVAETVTLAHDAGLSGCSIEDTRMIEGHPAYGFDEGIARIGAAAEAARSLPDPFVLCARADGVMNGSYGMDEAIDRIRAYASVGADLVYVPLVPDLDALREVIAATSKPVNALAAGAVTKMTVPELAELGVRRISVGSQIARLTHAAVRDSMHSILSDGSFKLFLDGMPGSDVDTLLDSGAESTR